jgi:hypothetical protein
VLRHIFSVAGNFELPFGPRKRLLNFGGPAGVILGGWELGTITRLRTGTPFSVTFSPSLPGWLGGRADRIGEATLSRSERSKDMWFDPAAFTVPAPYTYGNASRNMLFGPGRIDIDLSLIKNTSITERVNLQLRGEFFNFPNHSNLANPAANISVPTQVGRITSVIGGRQIQLGGKLIF